MKVNDGVPRLLRDLGLTVIVVSGATLSRQPACDVVCTGEAVPIGQVIGEGVLIVQYLFAGH